MFRGEGLDYHLAELVSTLQAIHIELQGIREALEDPWRGIRDIMQATKAVSEYTPKTNVVDFSAT